jgi:predicted amidohydrolase
MVRIAACQISPSPDIKIRKAQMHNMLIEAEKEHIELICFPEGFLTGYYDEEDLAFKNSLEVGEAHFNEWLEVVKNYSSTIIVGFNERAADKIFDSAAVIENGKLLGIQRKHYLYHNYFTSDSSFTVFKRKKYNIRRCDLP